MHYLEAFAAHLPETRSRLNPPATLEQVAQAETELGALDRVKGAKLPPSYKAFLLRWDGGSFVDEEDVEDDGESEDFADGYGSYVTFVSIGDYPGTYDRFMDWNDEDSAFMDEEIETYRAFQPLIIFAMDEGGSFWAFDPREVTPEGEMPVRYCDHESGAVHEQAADFPAFITALTNRTLMYRGLGYPD
jgi:hypothetical protein